MIRVLQYFCGLCWSPAAHRLFFENSIHVWYPVNFSDIICIVILATVDHCSVMEYKWLYDMTFRWHYDWLHLYTYFNILCDLLLAKVLQICVEASLSFIMFSYFKVICLTSCSLKVNLSEILNSSSQSTVSWRLDMVAQLPTLNIGLQVSWPSMESNCNQHRLICSRAGWVAPSAGQSHNSH